MSKYTTQVRFICESECGLTESEGFNSVDTIIEKAAPKVFNFDFPVFDIKYRLPLEKKILSHYYTREIGEETYGLWKLRLSTRLREIMPYYNKLYESELYKFNPFYDIDLTTRHEKINVGHNTEKEDVHGNTFIDTENKAVTNTTEAELGTSETERNQTTATLETGERDNNSTTATMNTQTSKADNTEANLETTQTGRDGDGTAYQLFSETPQGAISFQDVNIGVNNGLVKDGTGNAYLTTATKNMNKDRVDETTSKFQGNTSTGESEQSNFTGETGSAEEKNSLFRGDTSAEQETDSTFKGKTGAGEVSREGNTTENTNKETNTVKDIKNTEDYLEHVHGKRTHISFSKLLQEFRETFLNIDMMIIEELSDLFLNLW